MGRMKFTIYRRLTLRGKRWFWNLKAGNGEIIASGEGYHNYNDCRDRVYDIMDGISEAKIETLA